MTKQIRSLSTIDGETLLARPYAPVSYLVDNLLAPGLYLLAGSAKIGKSWLALWLCMQIAAGCKVWDFETQQGTALYLCLEDSENRIQNRLHCITEEDTDLSALHFATHSQTLTLGLEQQITYFYSVHPDTKLVVIDTLQKVRDSSKDTGYANDYTELGQLKSLADTLGITILLIHHLRKSVDADPFNMISGTTGITGVVDGSFVLTKERRNGSRAKLICTGRDISERELTLEFDGNTHLWRLTQASESDQESDIGPLVVAIASLMQQVKTFCGSASELLQQLPHDVTNGLIPNTLSKRLLQSQGELLAQGIELFHRRANGKRILELRLKCEFRQCRQNTELLKHESC